MQVQTTTALRFTAADLLSLEALRLYLEDQTSRRVDLHTCAEDGDEWALFALAEDTPEGFQPLVSVQTLMAAQGPAYDLVDAWGHSGHTDQPAALLGALSPLAGSFAVQTFRSMPLC